MNITFPRRLGSAISGSLVVFGLSGAALAAQPTELPMSGNLPACEHDKADKLAFPCAVIITGLESDDLEAVGRRHGGEVRHKYKSFRGAAVTIKRKETLDALAGTPGVEVIPDRPVHAIGEVTATGTVATAATSTQVVPAGVRRIGAAPGVLSYTGRGVGVAVVDTGLDFAHRDLSVRTACFDAFGGGCRDANGHGTHVGGIVAARNNAVGVVGVAPEAALYAVRVLNSSGSGSDSTILAGLDWVARNGATFSPPIRVVNLSLGRPGRVDDNRVMRQMMQTLVSRGITVIAAAGNNPTLETSQFVPAAYPEVISVASTTAVSGNNACSYYSGYVRSDTASSFTTDGAGTTISAPGADRENITSGCGLSSYGILSLRLGGGTARMSGTSMAAPHVAGVAALLLQTGRYYDPSAIRAALQGSAARVGTAPLDSPSSRYTFDGVREGVLSACRAIGVACP